jgi:hypothetical protein
MPKRKSTRMRGGGLWDTIKDIAKKSGVISTAIGQIPFIGGVAGPAVRALTGYGRKRKMRGRGGPGVKRVILV